MSRMRQNAARQLYARRVDVRPAARTGLDELERRDAHCRAGAVRGNRAGACAGTAARRRRGRSAIIEQRIFVGDGVVVERELLCLSVFLHDERSDKLRLLCSRWNLHALSYVGSRVIGSEVKDGESVEAYQRHGEYEQRRVVAYYPLVTP